MSRTTRLRRSAWVAGAMLGIVATTTATPVQAFDLVSPRGDQDDSCVLSEDVVFEPGGGSQPLPLPGTPRPGFPLPTFPLPTGPVGDISGSGSGSTAMPDLGAGDRLPIEDRDVAPLAELSATPRLTAQRTAASVGNELTYLEIETLPESELGPRDWGMTRFDAPKIKIGAVCVSPGRWAAVIEQATQQTHMAYRILDRATRVNRAFIDGMPHCAVLRGMAAQIHAEAQAAAVGGRDDTTFYVLEAVKNHEDEHVARYRERMVAPFQVFKKRVSEIVVDAATEEKAVKAILGSAAYKTARLTFDVAELDVNNWAAGHDPGKHFVDAEQAVVEPMVEYIKQRRATIAANTGAPC